MTFAAYWSRLRTPFAYLPCWECWLPPRSCSALSIRPPARGFSALTVDAHTGEVLFSQAPDAQRYPASLTKVMTLYILFEEIKAGPDVP